MVEVKKLKVKQLHSLLELWKISEEIDLNEYDDSLIRLKYFIKRNKKYCFGAFFDNKLVGGALAGEDGKRGTIYHLVVDENFRNKGIGKEIVKKICQSMKNNGIYKVNVTAFKQSNNSCFFWKKMNFKERVELSMFSFQLTK